MKRFYISVLVMMLLGLMSVPANADIPFREHRYDVFTVLPVNGESIVFYGNSITNMHGWCEAFGCDNVLNRGVSGALTSEMLDNIGYIISGHPAKIFILGGTNDLGTQGLIDPQLVAGNIEKMVCRIQEESPETEIYVQSIFPSTVGLRTLTNIQDTNSLLKDMCLAKGVGYIDLYDDLYGILSGDISYDGLHLDANGYQIWCNKISELTGLQCAYPEDAEMLHGGFGSNSFGMRITQFGALPVDEDDVLFFGDEMVHGGEWHELLHCAKIKNRGTGWGYQSLTIPDLVGTVAPMLTGNGNKKQPSKILVYAGATDISYNVGAYTLIGRYKKLIEEIRKYAPETKIYCLSQLPLASASKNRSTIETYNALLKDYADATEGLEYVDVYEPMLEGGVQNPEFFRDNYLYGLGYARMSEIIAPLLAEEGARATTVEEVRAHQTGIKTNPTSPGKNGTYTLQGHPATPETRGLLIHNGKLHLLPGL